MGRQVPPRDRQGIEDAGRQRRGQGVIRPGERLAELQKPSTAAHDGALPETALLLTGGGDTRIALDPKNAANKYGCPPFPAPTFAAFGSSTASTISTDAFAAAERLRVRLAGAATDEPAAATYARELQRMRDELRAVCGLDRGVDIVFGASGTDLHLVAAQMLRAAGEAPPLVVMVEASETGSGVPAALAGRYFSAVAPLGDTLVEGTPALAGLAEIIAVPTREADGALRHRETIDAEVRAIVAAAATLGRRILVTMVDVSKTGIVAPSPACAVALRRQWPDQVQVLVDACQFRLAPATLNAYLGADCVVAVTGSKFVTGPAFSGALLIPESIAADWRRRTLSPALRAFSARAEWPASWPQAQTLRDTANYGLLLRWEAALHELHAFHAVPEAKVAAILERFARAAEARLTADPAFGRLPTPVLDRGDFGGALSWDRLPTIFPFLLRGGRERFLDRDETARVHRLLTVDAGRLLGLDLVDRRYPTAAQSCQVGQPVPCGERDGVKVAALRLCASARLVAEAAAGPGGADRMIARAMQVLDKTALLARHVAHAAATTAA
jgi:selenocysteine lyase/cysteine desulfurase